MCPGAVRTIFLNYVITFAITEDIFSLYPYCPYEVLQRRQKRVKGGINGDGRLDLGWSTQHNIQMMCYRIVHLKSI